jgi:two-component system nitrogen regulation response regulator GlnG
MKHKVLLLDNDVDLSRSLKDFLFADNYDVMTENYVGPALEKIRNYNPDVAIVDIILKDCNGIDVLRQIKQIDPNISVIVITGQRSRRDAIRAMQNGAFDFLLKPLDPGELRMAVKKAVKNSRLSGRIPAEEPGEEHPDPDCEVGMASAAMLDVWKKVGSVAGCDATILIRGETGTGKEVIANTIHAHSKRKDMPFLALNCAALPDTLLESELFGHEKGAFTGAHVRKPGKFELSEGGTLFLDEIAEMSLANQGKLLRVLENRTFERVGGQDEIKSDVRIIAATNKSLADAVKEKKFRIDLMYRLNVVTISLPPLRERLEDLVMLVDVFIGGFSAEYGKQTREIAPDALDLLTRQRWEGNIRELKNVISSAVLLSKGPVLTVDDLLPLLTCQEKPDNPFSLFLQTCRPVFKEMCEKNRGAIYDDLSSALQKALVQMALEHTGNNQVMAASLLGISRNTLRDRMEP